MISAFMMHKTQVVDPICTKAEANELNTFGVESCYLTRDRLISLSGIC